VQQTNIILKVPNLFVFPETETVPDNFRQLAHNLIKNYCKRAYGQYYGPDIEDYTKLEKLDLKLFNENKSDKLFYFIHGGGFFFGRPESYGSTLRDLSYYSNSNVAAIDYRLIPDNYIFSCLEDSLAGYLYIIGSTQMGGKGYKASDVVIGGDSAGGGMTGMITHFLRNTEQAQPAAAIMWSPNLDLTSSQPSEYIMGDKCIVPGPLDKPIISGNLVIRTKFWELPYSGANQHLKQRMSTEGSLFGPKQITYWPLLSPMMDPDLTGLPPILIMNGEYDTFRDSGIVYARRLVQQKSKPSNSQLPQVTVQIYQGQPHDFIIVPFSPFSDDSLKRAGNFIKLAHTPESKIPPPYTIQNSITESKFGQVPQLNSNGFSAYYITSNKVPIVFDPKYKINPFPIWDWGNTNYKFNVTSLLY
jgi:acetyl esterase/lipase